MKEEEITPINCCWVGLGYFISRPHLWLAPLLAALISLFILIGAFFFTAYMSWPPTSLSWLNYTWGIFKSFGYASFIVIALWVSVFPLILNFAFENMIGKILQNKKISIKNEGMVQATSSNIQMVFRTMSWRLFWPFMTFISLFFFGPLAIFIAQIGIGHIAMIDAVDLALSVQGKRGSARIFAIKSKKIPLLSAGFIAGMLSMILTTTIIGWLFWLPSVYAGCTLWTLSWKTKF